MNHLFKDRSGLRKIIWRILCEFELALVKVIGNFINFMHIWMHNNGEIPEIAKSSQEKYNQMKMRIPDIRFINFIGRSQQRG